MELVKNYQTIWASMKNVQDGLGVKNMSNLILKEIYGIYETKNLTKEQIKKCKMTERQIFGKQDNISEDELNTNSSKNVYVENDVMSSVIKGCKGEKKRQKNNRRIQKKVDDDCPEHEVKSKIESIYVNEKYSKIILLRFIKLILTLVSITRKKCKLIKMNASIYYLELMFSLLNFFQLQKLMKKNMLEEILFLRRKGKKHQKETWL